MTGPDVDRVWETLASAATLGTGRAALPADLPLPSALALPADGGTERRVLRAAMAVDVWRTAGTRSGAAQAAEGSDAPPVRAAEIGDAAAGRLVRMLTGEHPELVDEWYQLARRAGRVLPPQWVPQVLDLLDAQARTAVADLLGEHGVWLAQQNPAWAWPSADAHVAEARWTTGTFEERVLALEAVRALNPAEGLAWLSRTWSTEPGDARERFIRALLVGLGPSDEPFLESALDDRRKGVRAAAADALARLPTSALVARMQRRLTPLLTFTPARRGALAMFSRPRLDVMLPDAPDEGAVRDGIERKAPARSGVGERSFWLAQMVGLVPPDVWRASTAASPVEFLDAAMGTDQSGALLAGLTAAAARHTALPWIEPLIDRWTAGAPDEEPHDAARSIVRLLQAASDPPRSTLLERWLAGLDARRASLGLLVLNAMPGPWTPGVTRAAFAVVAELVRRDRQTWSHPRTALAAWGVRADLTEAEPLMAAHLQAAAESPWRNAIGQVADLIDVRRAMHKELQT